MNSEAWQKNSMRGSCGKAISVLGEMQSSPASSSLPALAIQYSIA